MIKRIINKIRVFSLLIKIEKAEPNNYILGSKVRRILSSYRDGIEIKEEEIIKYKPKP